MPRKKKVEEEVVVEETVEETPVETKTTARDEATVVYAGGKTRTYTKEVHGEDFVKLAEQFADKFDGKVL